MSVNEVRTKRVADIDAFVVRGSGYPATNRTFCIGNEDHTIGNALRHVLIQNSNVTFAGYSVPHPSEPIVQIRIQTNNNSSNNSQQQQQYNNPSRQQQQQQQSSTTNNNTNNRTVTAIDALRQSCLTLHDQCDLVMDQLEELLPDVREDRIKMENFHIQNEDYNNEDYYDDANVEDEEDHLQQQQQHVVADDDDDDDNNEAATENMED
jgi:DNA-directed RNA polymerases I and III subunit RPAC2